MTFWIVFTFWFFVFALFVGLKVFLDGMHRDEPVNIE